jgi:hypothetical protein
MVVKILLVSSSFRFLAEISRTRKECNEYDPCGHAQINKTVCKKEFQVKLRTFHQLKTNDFDDGGLDDHWGLQFFFSFQEEEPKLCRWLTSW